MMEDLKDKVVVITGGSDGIGARIAERFAEQGSRLAICGRSQEKLHKVAARCREAGLDQAKILLVKGDLLVEQEINEMTSQIINHYHQVDVLVNNAGLASTGGIAESSLEDYDTMYRLHIRAVVTLVKAFLPLIKAVKGNIINISSDSATNVDYQLLAYSVMKAGLDHLTRCLAAELAPEGVRVNGLNLGVIQTGIFMKSGLATSEEEQKKLVASYGEGTPLRRTGQTDDVADAVLFVASRKASFITGANIPVDGGSSL